ncbi:hypothetical protein NY98_12015 [Xanthomonas citri pv. fuscans]|uniref:Uncharacterized protein n=4 Tax=Xanthomonas TaxID=338 RepID=A0A8I1XQR9_XANMN|nr:MULTISPECIES: hypothetical protein [Xanthomonas]AAO72131.1 hypothetical protein [Xanthomonas citri]AMV01008.1 hypothetical protein TP37_23455 [Xanthomonas citri pv. aurantifolii]AMV09369.1 hypothetical protein AC028_21365 [Xanthomonas citri pv. aurantifolii]ARE58964.1 hypothetical protein TP45_21690 [Xanthomonas citri pv. aurantifolii]ATS65491.1 hypothetical protein XcfCFBP4885P_20655 [Xanthomonas citri pv. phaseoli var. fuscans]
MADVSMLKKLKGRRDELGAPPTLDEASTNLTAPEVAPVTRPVAAANPPPQARTAKKIDGRSARKTNRTVQFATRVTPEWDARIRALAQREGVLLVEILEKALAHYEQSSS